MGNRDQINYNLDIIAINPATGEIVTPKSSLSTLSDTRKVWSEKEKEAKKIVDNLTEVMQPIINQAFDRGETHLMNYWIINKPRVIFSSERFETEAPALLQTEHKRLKERLAEIEENYKAPDGNPFLKHPKF